MYAAVILLFIGSEPIWAPNFKLLGSTGASQFPPPGIPNLPLETCMGCSAGTSVGNVPENQIPDLTTDRSAPPAALPGAELPEWEVEVAGPPLTALLLAPGGCSRKYLPNPHGILSIFDTQG